MSYRIRVLIEVRNGDGNFLREANRHGNFHTIENGNELHAVNQSGAEAIADLYRMFPAKEQPPSHD